VVLPTFTLREEIIMGWVWAMYGAMLWAEYEALEYFYGGCGGDNVQIPNCR
jgi:hypothetical protein